MGFSESSSSETHDGKEEESESGSGDDSPHGHMSPSQRSEEYRDSPYEDGTMDSDYYPWAEGRFRDYRRYEDMSYDDDAPWSQIGQEWNDQRH